MFPVNSLIISLRPFPLLSIGNCRGESNGENRQNFELMMGLYFPYLISIASLNALITRYFKILL